GPDRAGMPAFRDSKALQPARQVSGVVSLLRSGGIMKRSWLAALVGGFALGLAAGYALGLLTRPGSSQRASPAATPDQVIAHVDFKAAVAWAGQGKWTVEAFPVDGLNATGYKPPSPS